MGAGDVDRRVPNEGRLHTNDREGAQKKRARAKVLKV
jgi:hypothetical protein